LIRINLLPIRAFKKKENIRFQVSVFGLSIIVFLVLLLGLWVNTNKKVSELLDEKDKLLRQAAAVREAQQTLNLQKQKTEILEKRIGVIVDLIKERSGPIYLLDEIIKRTPSDAVWLTELKQQVETIKVSVPAPPEEKKKDDQKKKKAPKDGSSREAKVKAKIITKVETPELAEAPKMTVEQRAVQMLTLSGVAKDNEAIVQYIQALEDSEILEDVTLIVSTEHKIDAYRLKKFSLKCTVNYLPEPEIVEEQEEGPAKG